MGNDEETKKKLLNKHKTFNRIIIHININFIAGVEWLIVENRQLYHNNAFGDVSISLLLLLLQLLLKEKKLYY